jgi:hypothetical protein
MGLIRAVDSLLAMRRLAISVAAGPRAPLAE